MSATSEKPEMVAVRAMRARGLDNPEELLHFAAADAILATCRWWDGLAGVRPGLLAKRIREGGVKLEPAQPPAGRGRGAQLRGRFEEASRRFPPRSPIEPHSRLQARRGHGDEPCGGVLRVFEAIFPNVMVVCDACGCEAAYPAGGLHVLPSDLRREESESGNDSVAARSGRQDHAAASRAARSEPRQDRPGGGVAADVGPAVAGVVSDGCGAGGGGA